MRACHLTLSLRTISRRYSISGHFQFFMNYFLIHAIFVKVCQVGRNRSYPVEKQQSIEEEISSMLKNARYGKQNNLRNFNDHSTEKLPQTYTNISSSYHHGNTLTDFPQTSLNQSQALKQFVPRSNTEPVKNCTKLDKQLLDKIVQKVATVLLSKQTEGETIECQEGDGSMTSKVWNKGGE